MKRNLPGRIYRKISQMKCQPGVRVLLLFIHFVVGISICKSEQDAADIFTKAMACLGDRSLYSACEEPLRLKGEGRLDVPAGGVSEYCGGPCLKETKLVLNCIGNIFSNFRFNNGATLVGIRHALECGCGHGKYRGDFNTWEKFEYGGLNDGDYGCHDYGHGSKLGGLSVYRMVALIALAFYFSAQ